MVRLFRELAELGDGSVLECFGELAGWALGLGGAVMLPLLIGLAL